MRTVFTLDDATKAGDEWGANCGPGALAAIMGLTLDEVRAHMGDFERKHYTNPSLMYEALRSLGVKWKVETKPRSWPAYGLVRIQWEGPWTAPGVPIRVRYRHTHWVGCYDREDAEAQLFDINCMCVGGWIAISEWERQVVPWLLRQCEPKANGLWHLTHAIEVITTPERTAAA